MKYILAYVIDGKLHVAVLKDKESVKIRISEIYTPEQIDAWLNDNTIERLFQVIEIEPNYEFLYTQVIFSKKVEIAI